MPTKFKKKKKKTNRQSAQPAAPQLCKCLDAGENFCHPGHRQGSACIDPRAFPQRWSLRPHSGCSLFKPSLPRAQMTLPVPWVPGPAPTATHPPQPCSASLAGGPGVWDPVPGLEYSRKSPHPAVELRTPRGQLLRPVGSVNALAVLLLGGGPALCPGLVCCLLQVKLLGEAHVDHPALQGAPHVDRALALRPRLKPELREGAELQGGLRATRSRLCSPWHPVHSNSLKLNY